MEKKIPFAPVVMLIDASYLDRVDSDMSAHFAPIVNRELPKADLANLLECLALDAGIQLGENEVQVIFIYDAGEEKMNFCTPSNLGKELHDVAFKSQLGNFHFMPSSLPIWQPAKTCLSSRSSWPVNRKMFIALSLCPMKTDMVSAWVTI